MSSEDVPPPVSEPLRSPSPPPSLRSRPSHGRKMSVDADAQAQVISSLRTQVDDLFSQVTQLNGKLVKSYNRVSDLEDELHVSSASAREASVKIASLELERATHLSALNTGLLVEREHVASELSRLMERATDEAARRGQAESARMEIEKDLDDLSAGLFDQANTMVAEARFARAQSERKAEEATRSLREAEDLVRLMQGQMQQLQQRATDAERAARDVVPQAEIVAVGIPRLLGSHAGYTEFIAFVAHIRTLRSAAGQPPIISTLLHTPFLARLVAEDTEPTVRLDLAPGLNWLTRRTFISAIHAGQLDITPAPTASLLSPESATHGLFCALCGAIIVPGTSSPTDTTPASRSNLGSLATAARNNSWSQLLSKPLNSSRPSSPPHTHSRQPSLDANMPAQIFVCRLATPVPASVPVPGQPRSAQTNQYPLCASGWCLARLRATCTLWSFVRTGVVERVWEDTPAPLPPPQRLASQSLNSSPVSPATPTNGGVTKKRSLWGVASVLGFGDDKEKVKEEKGKAKELPPPPPHHPAEKPLRRAVPPPLASPVPRPAAPGQSPIPPPRSPNLRPSSTQTHPAPPPLPRRATSRAAITPVGLKPSSSQEPDSDGGFHTPAEELPPITNGDGEHEEGEHKPGHAKKDSMLFEAPFTPPATPPVPEGAAPDAEPKPAETVPVVEGSTPADAGPSADAPVTEGAAEPAAESAPATDSAPTPAPAPESTAPAEPHTPTNPAFAEGTERTSSPAPPPVPRRAPARRAVPPAPGTPGRTGTPVNGERVGTPVQDATATTSATAAPSADAPVSAPEAPAATEAPAAQAPVVEAPSTESAPAPDAAIVTEASAPEASEAKPPLPARPRRAPRDSVHMRGGSVSSLGGLEKAGDLKEEEGEKAEEEAPVVNGVDKGKGKAIEPSSSAESDIKLADERVNTDAEPITFANNSEQPSPAVEEPEELAPDGTPFVRGASWEARAWKELVRLREDMFWARVGGVR